MIVLQKELIRITLDYCDNYDDKNLILAVQNDYPEFLQEILINDDELDEIKSKNYKYIKKFNCSYSEIITDDDIKNMIDLEYLSCMNTKISDEGIKNLHNLKHLHCYDTQITCDGIQNLSRLIYLDCENTQITDHGIRYLRKLETLICMNTKITDDGIINMMCMSNLKELQCDSKMISKNTLNDLKINGVYVVC